MTVWWLQPSNLRQIFQHHPQPPANTSSAISPETGDCHDCRATDSNGHFNGEMTSLFPRFQTPAPGLCSVFGLGLGSERSCNSYVWVLCSRGHWSCSQIDSFPKQFRCNTESETHPDRNKVFLNNRLDSSCFPPESVLRLSLLGRSECHHVPTTTYGASISKSSGNSIRLAER